MGSLDRRRAPFFPTADAAVLLSKHPSPTTRPQTLGPIYDADNIDRPIEIWNTKIEKSFYPPKTEPFAPASIPDKFLCETDRYLRAFLAENERLRLSMLWYYTRDILEEHELLSGLQEKAHLAQDSTKWEYAVVGILDVHVYIRLATVGLPLGILPRGETICAHTVAQPLGSVFLLPDMMEDWRFQNSPYVESGGLKAYAGAPLRLQDGSGGCVALGSLCVASSTKQDPLTKSQQHTLAHLADWIVSDIVQCARARRQRERRRMAELITKARAEMDEAGNEEPIFRMLKAIYPKASITLVSCKAARLEVEGRDPILMSDIEHGLWEDSEYLDHLITKCNHQDLPSNRVVRVLAATCESIAGLSMLAVASKDFRLVFDDIDSWFIQTCADMVSQMWHKQLLAEATRAKDKFLRGISHQLRTPIHGILGSVELLAEELGLLNLHESSLAVSTLLEESPTTHPSIYLNTIKRSGRDLISIVNSMITLDRWADVATSERCYAAHTIQELEAELANEIHKTFSGDTRYNPSILFNHCLPSDCESLQLDINLLRDTLWPLLSNAIQNTPEGTVTVTTSLQPDSRILIIDVEDTGRGIHPDQQERIFEPYETVRVHSSGVGLGLTLACKFATLIDGSIDLVSSQVDSGSHFRATFQNMEWTTSTLLSHSISKNFSLPSNFYNMTPVSNTASLCSCFAKFLTFNGFTSSNSTEDCFIILDYVPELEQRQTYLSKIPSDQVAICLVPASKGDVQSEEDSNNIVYVNGPFLTSTMTSALQEADRLLSRIKTSQLQCLTTAQAKSPPVMEECITELRNLSMIDLPQPEKQPAQLLKYSSAERDVEPTVTLSCQPASATLIEPKLVSPTFPAHINISKPIALLVDDNVINLRIMQMFCRRRGLPYLCAADGLQAVEMFTKHQALAATGEKEAIQLILMDLQMPVCDGIEATKQIRTLEKQQRWKESILFMVTGQDSATDRMTAEGAGADDYFVKPVSIQVLDGGIKRYFPAFMTN
ncbi:histidine kinase HHK3 [Dactylonectria macrodidyma]|uniref:histidine kinase n=1 Tax=Dactylonectria macrodidyma TaxID=307937 RepID=A0A9P9ER63_9HYPO|nr:histidine kinase HHK3 [Dactylonectria macrodidyma]